jgi:hypothetical protein
MTKLEHSGATTRTSSIRRMTRLTGVRATSRGSCSISWRVTRTVCGNRSQPRKQRCPVCRILA